MLTENDKHLLVTAKIYALLTISIILITGMVIITSHMMEIMEVSILALLGLTAILIFMAKPLNGALIRLENLERTMEEAD